VSRQGFWTLGRARVVSEPLLWEEEKEGESLLGTCGFALALTDRG
jgi:hypothetical protein